MKKIVTGKKGALTWSQIIAAIIAVFVLVFVVWQFDLLSGLFESGESTIDRVTDPCPCGGSIEGSVLNPFRSNDICVNSYSQDMCEEAGFTWNSRQSQCEYTREECKEYLDE